MAGAVSLLCLSPLSCLLLSIFPTSTGAADGVPDGPGQLPGAILKAPTGRGDFMKRESTVFHR